MLTRNEKKSRDESFSKWVPTNPGGNPASRQRSAIFKATRLPCSEGCGRKKCFFFCYQQKRSTKEICLTTIKQTHWCFVIKWLVGGRGQISKHILYLIRFILTKTPLWQRQSRREKLHSNARRCGRQTCSTGAAHRPKRNNQVYVRYFHLQMKIYRVNRNIPLSPSSPHFPFQEGHWRCRQLAPRARLPLKPFSPKQSLSSRQAKSYLVHSCTIFLCCLDG